MCQAVRDARHPGVQPLQHCALIQSAPGRCGRGQAGVWCEGSRCGQPGDRCGAPLQPPTSLQPVDPAPNAGAARWRGPGAPSPCRLPAAASLAPRAMHAGAKLRSSNSDSCAPVHGGCWVLLRYGGIPGAAPPCTSIPSLQGAPFWMLKRLLPMQVVVEFHQPSQACALLTLQVALPLGSQADAPQCCRCFSPGPKGDSTPHLCGYSSWSAPFHAPGRHGCWHCCNGPTRQRQMQCTKPRWRRQPMRKACALLLPRLAPIVFKTELKILTPASCASNHSCSALHFRPARRHLSGAPRCRQAHRQVIGG